MAKTLSAMAAEVQIRLGDAAAGVWTAAEIKRYLQEGYRILAARTECFWKEGFLNDAANTCNITNDWERDFAPMPVLGIFSFTAAFEVDYLTGLAEGPANHTSAFEATETGVTFLGKAVYDLPAEFIQMERVTWDNRRIDPLYSSELEWVDAQYQSRKGQPTGYILDKDGLRRLRKVLIPTVAATGTTLNFKIEYIRKGSTVASDSDVFELPDRYTKYLRHYACWRCLEREGLGQDLALAGFWKTLYEAGIARMIRRKQLFNRRRIIRLRGARGSECRPPLARLPWQYGRIVN